MTNGTQTYRRTGGGIAAGFIGTQRRRIMAALRRACRILGIRRKGIGLGPLGFTGSVGIASSSDGLSGTVLAAGASLVWLLPTATFVSLASYSPLSPARAFNWTRWVSIASWARAQALPRLYSVLDCNRRRRRRDGQQLWCCDR